MRSYKVIIIDDELPARNLLKEYLSSYTQMQLIAECKNGVEAIGLINVLQPDLIFLDIQMPGKNGFEVLQEIDFIPLIIFSTAYDKYAIQAFEVNAVDYLLKPFTLERFKKAADKLLDKNNENLLSLQALTESFQQKEYPERILVECGNKLTAINMNDIIYLEAEGDYTKLHTRNQQFLSNKGISELEEKLHPKQFIRIHRSYIIALSAIKEVHKEVTGPHVLLVNDVTIKVSRTYTDNFKKLIY